MPLDEKVDISADVCAKIKRISVQVYSDTNTLPYRFERHLKDFENPHKVTAEQAGAVNIRLNAYPEANISSRADREAASIYLDDGVNSSRLSMEKAKTLLSRIHTADSDDSVEKSKLSKDDYVFIKI